MTTTKQLQERAKRQLAGFIRTLENLGYVTADATYDTARDLHARTLAEFARTGANGSADAKRERNRRK